MNPRRHLWLFFLLAILTGVFEKIPASLADVIMVCPTCPVSQIQHALQTAQPGDEIRVLSGTYAEGALRIEQPLRLIGVNRPVIDGLHQGHVIDIQSDAVTIEGFVICNSGASDIAEYAGVNVEAARDCQIRRNTFTNNVYSVYLGKVENCLIEGNAITGNTTNEVSGGNGIHLWYSKKATVRGNTITNHRDGLYFEFSGDSLIEDNISRGNIRYGLHFMYSSGNRYLRNVFSSNQTGVAVMYSKNITMRGNRFEKSWGRTSYGLLLKDISESAIDDNAFAGNTMGIFIDGATRVGFLRNTFRNNGWAVNILGNAEDNVFEDNDFISNYFNVATNTQSASNRFQKNYWSDYDGYDLQRDGIGDVPFRPMKIFSLWVNRFPELVVLLGSPAVEFLEVAERTFPILTPKALEDASPRMRPRESQP